MNNKRKIDQHEELMLIKLFAEQLNLDGLQSPIECIKIQQLNKGESIPDAILYLKNGIKKYLEITTFSRSNRMRQSMGDYRKSPKRNDRIIPGVPIDLSITSLVTNVFQAITKKIHKRYSQFALLSKTEPRGILLVTFIAEDPLFTKHNFHELIHSIKDKHILFSWQVDLSNFDEIIIGAFCLDENNQWNWVFETLVNSIEMEILRRRRETKVILLQYS